MTADDKLEIRAYLEEKVAFLGGRELPIAVRSCPDESDCATMLAEVHCNVILREREARELRDILRALEKLKAPGFGLCEDCGEPIGLARLKARPQARFCIECQTARELVAA
ncbi:TraR/DksA family transcriptional regulator [Desulfocurvus sp.]|uniref:TraR/DksA family transcriptional regulator n=1 Tax=Desulfocurvus sp. TaxID=2871698 RepID=UPI0025BFB7CB|nr:TraR/DksA family transcriptional regulator [Desulfocurvus sp.]MCK9240945.1 TraR/DksA family transcriptional regulator [Desulfocurvus sp.]